MTTDSIVDTLENLGMSLPAPLQLPPNIVAKFPFVRIIGNRALVSGHGPLNAGGTIVAPGMLTLALIHSVHYDFTWYANGEKQPITLGNFIVRYWPK